jgi:choline-sulfatase
MKPSNLLVILSDQHSPRVAGSYGHPIVKTPNLDRLAARGTRFTSAYTNCPICVPARASFATGRYVHQIRFWDNAIAYDGSVPSWGHRLMAQGHHVTSVGKLHYVSSDPARNGFHEEIVPMHIADGIGDLSGLIRDEIIVRSGARKLGPEAGPGESEYSEYDRNIATEACKWLEQVAPKHRDKPWVLYVGFVCPHPPFVAPKQFFDLYDEKAIPMPDRYAVAERPHHPYLDALARGRPFDEGFTGPDMVRRTIAAYFGLVSFLDDNVGKVLAALERAGLAASTRVLYGTDHGENLGTRGLWQKSTLFEESAGIPLIMAGPDVPQGRSVDTPVTLVDAFPTILQAVGARPSKEDQDLPGASLMDIAKGAVRERSALSEYHAAASISGSFMVRRGRYKYIHYVGFQPMLFDLEADPRERRDLASEPAFRPVLEDYERELRRLLDPDAVDRQARADQARYMERFGGKAAILKRGAFTHTPPPGMKATLHPVEVDHRV